MQAAIRLKPDDPFAHNKLGQVLFEKGQTDDAIRQYQEAVRLKPNYANALTNLAKAMELKSRSNPPTLAP